MTELTPRRICPDFDEWPDSWKGVPEDLKYGRELLAIFESFCEELISQGLAKSTVRRHMDNLWVVGGELIRIIHDDNTWRGRPAVELLWDQIRYGEGPYCRHLDTEAEICAVDATCRKLYKFLRSRAISEINEP